jgi:hypothetical protein
MAQLFHLARPAQQFSQFRPSPGGTVGTRPAARQAFGHGLPELPAPGPTGELPTRE